MVKDEFFALRRVLDELTGRHSATCRSLAKEFKAEEAGMIDQMPYERLQKDEKAIDECDRHLYPFVGCEPFGIGKLTKLLGIARQAVKDRCALEERLYEAETAYPPNEEVVK